MAKNWEDEFKYLKSILAFQFSEDFVRKMKARMFVGYHRYGESKQYAKENKYDIMETIAKRLDAYKQTGNKEHLVDAANFIMIEYMYSQHLNAHFESVEEEDEEKRLGVVKAKDVEVLLKAEEELERGLK